MTACVPEYVAVASPWDRQWEIFVLDATGDLVGRTRAVDMDGVEQAARAFLRAHLAGTRQAVTVRVANDHWR
jgi:hypothetical protein